MGVASGTILSLIYYKQGPPRHKFEWENEPDNEDEGTEDYQETENEEEAETTRLDH